MLKYALLNGPPLQRFLPFLAAQSKQRRLKSDGDCIHPFQVQEYEKRRGQDGRLHMAGDHRSFYPAPRRHHRWKYVVSMQFPRKVIAALPPDKVCAS
jgi:hypothetical protein